MIKHFVVTALICGYASIELLAQNPIVQTNYTPDPAPMVYKDRVYVYAGDDIPGFDFYYMTKWRLYSSADMVNWTDHGVPLALEDFSWAIDRAWAAQCVERNGKFYWYICAQTDKNNIGIGVAVSDSPTGPFKDAIGKPLVMNGSWANIDPTVHIDDDGQAYMYWGNGSLFYVKLNADMVSYSGDIIEVPQTVESFGGVRGPRGETNQTPPAEPKKDMFIEGPWLYKRNNIYYQMFAGMEKGTECLSYSISESPIGPWKYQGRIMVNQPTNSFTNHGGIVDFKGNSYLFYHTGLLPGGGSYGRASAVEEFKYNPDGTIPLISISKEGPKPVGKLNSYIRNEAETIAWSEKCKTTQDENVGVYVTSIRTGGSIKVREVDFGSTSPKKFKASLASGLGAGILEVYVDSIGGPKVATLKVPRTGGWKAWQTLSTTIETPVTGKKDVYFAFKGENLTAGRELYNFDYWIFEK
ncbi:glycoside hydrolase family 43 protein [Sphingobacterium bovistauri]|uniref:Family 43 glycosylhydrolase n=1 Tax=Sphingobacterium bovistauri TaxID=2781959 RepID=A0ABS7Z397_9SPHI|nr:glycoside hydrolase family 43 protein [Sphingobacterium bovistauri]MCA5004633.1 family 43 glycosylhydrolase [Sphingobacterium bovistauri]